MCVVPGVPRRVRVRAVRVRAEPINARRGREKVIVFIQYFW